MEEPAPLALCIFVCVFLAFVCLSFCVNSVCVCISLYVRLLFSVCGASVSPPFCISHFHTFHLYTSLFRPSPSSSSLHPSTHAEGGRVTYQFIKPYYRSGWRDDRAAGTGLGGVKEGLARRRHKGNHLKGLGRKKDTLMPREDFRGVWARRREGNGNGLGWYFYSSAFSSCINYLWVLFAQSRCRRRVRLLPRS